jgi:hypothetical protein
MEPYKNLGGDSNVIAYEIGDDWIKVQFRHSPTYTYTYQSAGQDTIERMKSLAIAGHGLNSYMTRVVKKRYASRG